MGLFLTVFSVNSVSKSYICNGFFLKTLAGAGSPIRVRLHQSVIYLSRCLTVRGEAAGNKYKMSHINKMGPSQREIKPTSNTDTNAGGKEKSAQTRKLEPTAKSDRK